MTTELTALGWTLVLAVVQFMLPAVFRTRETGLDYNAGPRDGDGPPVGVVTGQAAAGEGRTCTRRCRCSSPPC